jgi:hypothetical protein
MTAINEEREHQELEALLPWYAAGTLSRRDANRVEQALAGDRELARQYDLVREELVETIHLNETLGAPSARAMERLFAAIDAEEARAPRYRRWFDLGSLISEFLSSLTPRTLAWTAIAAAGAMLVQVAAAWRRNRRRTTGVLPKPPRPATLGRPPRASAASRSD